MSARSEAAGGIAGSAAALALAINFIGGWEGSETTAYLRRDLAALQLQLSACGGRLQTVLDDKGSDHAVDQMPDTDLIVVPDHWLRP
ncbi:hypothetical protein DS901_13845 [Loktanella sp. D2R18]|uniref:hypothetical protein n=1 Tax=Rhodobacterales TaxID=204455 RepID=UPI000DE954AC|nr:MULTISPECIES: hypothetical protein [Rhodobacterales]MDO6588942.1 hypothetical protein [Yoonia sp. 1_MG-2023]RBW41839.1 hypothetical protein DS901_13845 [Loktanella sp. D2R18]